MTIKNKILGVTKEDVITRLIFLIPIIFIVAAFVLDTPQNLINGLGTIATTRDHFSTDYYATVGKGTAFLNAGLLCLIYAVLLKISKANLGGITLAAQYICAGFAFIGKNIFNFLPIYLGVYLYSLFRKESFKNHIYVAMFSSAVAPIVSELYCCLPFEPIYNVLISIGVGLAVGFVLSPLSAFTMSVHRGYSLYNLGFSTGLVGLLFVSFFKVFGMKFEAGNDWYYGDNTGQLIFFGIICVLFIVYALLLDKTSYKEGVLISKESGRAVSDYMYKKGPAPTLFNMGCVGLLTVLFVALTKTSLSGGNLFAGLFSILGFAAFGKNIRNVAYIYLGATIGHLLGMFDITNNIYAFCVLIGTCIAPIGGTYGLIGGIIAIWCHLAIVTNTAQLHGWLSLYNNGFAGGLVALILVPIFDGIKGGFIDAKRRKEDS